MKNCAVIGSLLLAVAVLFARRAEGVQVEESGAARLIPIWPLESFILSPDGDSLLSWRSGQARLLDRETHAVRLHVELGDGETFSPSFFGARFAQDGTRAVLWTSAGDLTLLQLDPPRVLWKEAPSDWRTHHAVRFDAQLRRAVKHKDRTLQVLDLLEAGPVDALPPISVVSGDPPAFPAVSLSEDGKRVLVETKRGIECVELDAPEGARTGPPVDLHGADSVQLFGDEERAIVLVREGAFLVDLRSGRVLVHRTLPLSRWQTRYTSTPASVLPIWGWHAGLRVLDVETLDVLWELEACELATYDPASDVVVVIQDLGGPVTVHDAGSGERLWGLEGRALDIAPAGLRRRAIVFDGAGKFLASSYDNSVRYSFDCRTGACEELPMVLHGTAAHAGPLTDDALWVADRGGELRSLSADDGSEQASVVLGEPLASVESIDGVLVAASQSGRTRVWRGPELEAVTEFDGGPEFALASGADRVISCGGDREGWVAWSIHTGGLLATGGEDLGTFVDVACDVDGRVVIALDEARNAHVWVDGEITPLEGLLSPVEELVVDPRGRWVALGALGRDGERMAPFLTVYDLVQTGPPRQLGVEGSFVWSGGHIRSLAVDHGAEFLVATTGKWGTVQCWNTSDWSHQWIYDFGGGSPSPLQLNLDEANGRAWVWGLSRDAPRALDLGTGKSVVDFGETLMGDFSPLGKQRGVTAIVNGCLVRLDHEGSEQWRRIDLGPLGAVISSAAGSVRGDAAALEHVFVRVGDRVVRASEVAEGE